MKEIVCSVLISSYQRLELFRRTLWAIATRPPSVPFEVVVADDGSTDDILGELKEWSHAFPWTFIRLDMKGFTAATGVEKFYNNPAWSNNVAFSFSRGETIYLQGNEVIPVGDAYDALREEGGEGKIVFSTTYDIPRQHLANLGKFGSDVDRKFVEKCYPWPLQGVHYRSDVVNYLSCMHRGDWERLGGFDERYVGGISAEDSDFIRRARKLGVKTSISEAVSLHQSHGGKTKYYNPTTIGQSRFQEGCAINRVIYDEWDGSYRNPQEWPWGSPYASEVLYSV